jgi:hypothetical protein
MKKIFLTAMFVCLVLLGVRDVQAQVYDSYYYDPYWDGAQYQQYPQEYDPYYELHALHYQLYLPQYQAYPGYRFCCGVGGFVVPGPVVPLPPIIVNPRSRTIRQK